MQSVMDFAATLRDDFEQTPFARFLGDEGRTAEQRLAFTRHFVGVAATFNDFCVGLGEQLADGDSAFAALMRAHVEDELHHYRWFVQDFAAVAPLYGTIDPLELLVDERTRACRTFFPDIAAALQGLDARYAFVAMEAIEVAARWLFDRVQTVARRLRVERGVELHYFGETHARAEAEHALHDPALEARMAAVELTPRERRIAYDLITHIGEGFQALLAGLHVVNLDWSAGAVRRAS